MNAIDTNVFVYAFDVDEPVKRAKANELLGRLAISSAETILLWQVAVELLSCFRRWESAGRISSENLKATFGDVLVMFELKLPSPSIFSITFDLRSRYSLSHWDSLLIAACKEAGVEKLFTEDMSDGADYDGVKVINPFV